MSCLKAKLSTSTGLTGTLSTGYAIPRTHVEVQEEAAMLIPTGLTTVTVTHIDPLYSCWLINLSESRRSNSFYVHIKSVSENTAELDVVNTGEAFTGSIGSTLWLCNAK